MLLLGSTSGGDMSADFGRIALDGGPGDGEAEFLANGLLRHRGPLGAGALILRVLFGRCKGVTFLLLRNA